MKGRSFILRCSAFFLLLIFIQKTGGGLFIHNALHGNPTANSQKEEKGKDLSYNCSCIDDFLMPFTEAADPICFQPVCHFMMPMGSFEEKIPIAISLYSSLRGPPVVIL